MLRVDMLIKLKEGEDDIKNKRIYYLKDLKALRNRYIIKAQDYKKKY